MTVIVNAYASILDGILEAIVAESHLDGLWAIIALSVWIHNRCVSINNLSHLIATA